METLYHTSSSGITEINPVGGCCENGTIFFSSNVYYMGNHNGPVYSLDVDDSEVIEVCKLYEDELAIEIIQDVLEVDREIAIELLCGDTSIYDEIEGEDLAEKSWWLQGQQAESAARLGYAFAQGEDEQGSVYMTVLTQETLSNMKEVNIWNIESTGLNFNKGREKRRKNHE